jgi:O-antigen/teichoic acid export membrane protein
MITLWPVVICGLLTLGIPVALRYSIRKKLDDAEELFSVALVFSVILGFVALAVGVLLIPHWLNHYSINTVRYAQAMMCFAPLVTVGLLLQGFLEARGSFGQSNSMINVPTAGTLLALLILYQSRALTTLSVSLAYTLPFYFITLITLLRVRHSIRWPTDFIRRSRLLLNFGSRAYGIDIINTLSAQIGQVLVIGLLSAASFGLYAVTLNVSRSLSVLSLSLDTVLFPKAAELEVAGAVALVSRSARLVFAANVISGFCLIAAMHFLIRLAYGAAYVSATHMAQVLTCEAILAGTTTTLAQAFMATDRPGLVTIFQAIGVCLTFPLMLILIPRFGLIGAAYALLISTTIRFGLVLGSYPVFLGHSVPSLILTRQDVGAITARFRRTT